MEKFYCTKCEKHTVLEANETVLSGMDYALSVIRCSECGNVVGVLESKSGGGDLKNMLELFDSYKTK